ncbi:hypothetical protein EYF80_038939 [Liparis tanakae]|uniref:Uncharacterized protein n=1 Tax=Liparis tanakae TaxID=230148 RepID=A0A4Z2GB91_9TELE|nr:hypothetical protein EYF80_038939 [Liparis tanakae]
MSGTSAELSLYRLLPGRGSRGQGEPEEAETVGAEPLTAVSWPADVQACEKPVIGWCKSVEIGGGETGGGGVSRSPSLSITLASDQKLSS